MPTPELLGLGIAFALSVIVTRWVEIFARRNALYARTTSRGAHQHPTPRLGGVAIAVATVVAMLVGIDTVTPAIAAFMVGGVALLLAGVIDDLRSLPVLPRYLVQIAVGGVTAIIVSPEIHVVLPGIQLNVGGWPAIAIIAIWITALINVFNFMDGIDGIAAGTAAATMPAALLLGGSAVDALAIGLVGACLGFLVWNHHPASIFMGDGGSQFLGYAVAMAFLVGAEQRLPAASALIALAPFLIDTSATLVRRAVRGENIFVAHNKHLYQRLVRSGRSHRVVAAGYTAASLGAAWIAVAYSTGAVWFQAGVVVAGALAWGLCVKSMPAVDGRRDELRTV